MSTDALGRKIELLDLVMVTYSNTSSFHGPHVVNGFTPCMVKCSNTNYTRDQIVVVTDQMIANGQQDKVEELRALYRDNIKVTKPKAVSRYNRVYMGQDDTEGCIVIATGRDLREHKDRIYNARRNSILNNYKIKYTMCRGKYTAFVHKETGKEISWSTYRHLNDKSHYEQHRNTVQYYWSEYSHKHEHISEKVLKELDLLRENDLSYSHDGLNIYVRVMPIDELNKFKENLREKRW